MTLSVNAVTGVKWTSVSTLVKAVLQILLLVVAARYLSSEQLGVYAVCQIVIGFSQLFMDVGIGNAIIHTQEKSSKILSELFSVNLFFSLIVSGCVYFSASTITHYFEIGNAAQIVEVLSISFIIAGGYRVHVAILQKEMKFSDIAKIEISSQIIGFITSLLLLVQGFGVLSLVLGYITNLTIQLLIYWGKASKAIYFTLKINWQQHKKIWHFGAFQTADSFVNYFNSQFDLILVGKLLGSEVLGGYSLIRQFCFRPAMVINPVFTRVAFPLMAKIKFSDKLPTIYNKLILLLSSINFPLYVAMAIFSEQIIVLLFGEKWLHLVPIMQVMSLWCLVRSAMNPVGSLMMATGKVRKLFTWNFSLLLFLPAAIFIGSDGGIRGITFALLLLQVALLFAHWYFLLYQSAKINLKEFFTSLAIPFFTAIIAGFVAALVQSLLIMPIMQFIFGLLSGLISYLLLSMVVNKELVKLLKGKFTFE